ncbi:hypothetical protein BLNAU_14388 [Blattamonas nauphoetae]|uniref:Uncharacterized protein n=1 Tax=Blattamonas nauphoetae TaxID=2049346 RepID=A0ABQ9XHB0_9EUKA|nr:hypothetical protein BLNAU_14388 [Blattamonas nauphoetae]
MLGRDFLRCPKIFSSLFEWEMDEGVVGVDEEAFVFVRLSEESRTTIDVRSIRISHPFIAIKHQERIISENNHHTITQTTAATTARPAWAGRAESQSTARATDDAVERQKKENGNDVGSREGEVQVLLLVELRKRTGFSKSESLLKERRSIRQGMEGASRQRWRAMRRQCRQSRRGGRMRQVGVLRNLIPNKGEDIIELIRDTTNPRDNSELVISRDQLGATSIRFARHHHLETDLGEGGDARVDKDHTQTVFAVH